MCLPYVLGGSIALPPHRRQRGHRLVVYVAVTVVPCQVHFHLCSCRQRQGNWWYCPSCCMSHWSNLFCVATGSLGRHAKLYLLFKTLPCHNLHGLPSYHDHNDLLWWCVMTDTFLSITTKWDIIYLAISWPDPSIPTMIPTSHERCLPSFQPFSQPLLQAISRVQHAFSPLFLDLSSFLSWW